MNIFLKFSFISGISVFSGSSISFGWNFPRNAIKPSRSVVVAKNSPVERFMYETPYLFPSGSIETRAAFSFSFSKYVPGVITLITSLLTIPLAFEASSSCSHIATL